ncbi:LD-carboxypeptidase [Paenibacillus campi]|uniref:S66 peptidase family protein n=1 Tax=Paenibacillus campi TaxID=3106031 RepID=UPI002AFF9024|nr:LD-carboxypeptidase [Paenibacillus sp. SGZ-1014]
MSTLQLNNGDTVALIACSDGISWGKRSSVDELIQHFNQWGLRVEEAKTLMQADYGWSGSPQERAAELNRLFADPTIKAIFDISGGDSANGILPYVDFDGIARSPKPLFGMSDLSVVLNAIYARTGVASYHYQVLNLVRQYGEQQRQRFYATFFGSSNDLYDLEFEFLRGEDLNGELIGGNLRCLLKLAGTPHFPHARGRVIMLEGLSGRLKRIISMLDQLAQTGALNECSGLLIGTFTELEQYGERAALLEYVLQITAARGIPVVHTTGIGHGSDSGCMIIG